MKLKKASIILIFCFWSFVLSYAQQNTFQKIYGGVKDDYGYSLIEAVDSGYIFLGGTSSFGAGNQDVYVVKFDNNGDTIWSKAYGGLGYDNGLSICQSSNRGYMIAGVTNSFGSGKNDVFLINIDSIGNVLWAKTVGGIENDYAWSISKTKDGGFIITGKTESYGATNGDVYLLKMSSEGNISWIKTFGSSGEDYGLSASQTNDGGYIIGGSVYDISGTHGANDMLVIKTDSIGKISWSKKYGDNGSELCRNIIENRAGEYIFTGVTANVVTGKQYISLIKINSAGDTLWSKKYQGLYANSIISTKRNEYVIVGEASNIGTPMDVYILKVDSAGDAIWANTFGDIGVDRSNSIIETSDNGYFIGGWKTTALGTGDLYLIKTDSMGESDKCFQKSQTITAEGSPMPYESYTPFVSSGGVEKSVSIQVNSGCYMQDVCLQSSVKEIVEDFLIISASPNSTWDKLSVKSKKILSGQILVYNLIGDEILKTKANAAEVEIDFSNLSSGIYILTFQSFDKKIVAPIKILKF